jgi:hypothetical protein
MFLQINYTEAIAGRSTTGAGFSFAGEANPHAMIDAGWNPYFPKELFEHKAGAATFDARIFDEFSCALTSRTGSLHTKDSAGLHDLAATAAVTASFRSGTGFRAAAPTFGTHFVSLEFHRLHNAAGGFEQIDFQFASNVFAFARPVAAAPSAKQVAEYAAAKHFAKGFENVLSVVKLMSIAFHSGVAVAIVARSLVAVRKYFERFGRLLKLHNRFMIVRIAVGVVL